MSSFTDLLGCRLPLQLAGMGGICTTPALPVAVAEAGGLGMFGFAGLGAADIAARLGSARASGPLGANFLMPFVDRAAVVAAARACALVEFFYGDPDAELVSLVHEHRSLTAWQVGSPGEAGAAIASGVDVLVVQGVEAGGHVRGNTSLPALLREIRPRTRLPLVAAGGIGTAEDVRRALDAGADAVRAGTRFVAAAESPAHPTYVEALVAAHADDTVMTEAFDFAWPHAPHRVLASCVEAVEALDDDVVGTLGDAPLPRRSTIPPLAGMSGHIDAMPMYAGTSVEAVRARRSAAEIVAELCSLA